MFIVRLCLYILSFSIKYLIQFIGYFNVLIILYIKHVYIFYLFNHLYNLVSHAKDFSFKKKLTGKTLKLALY